MPARANPQVPPVVSVITIFRDAASFIEEAIASVVGQSYEHWELVLVDDGSRDASARIARAWAERHPGRIRLLAHPGGGNRGMSASRNLGLRAARGRCIAFLDADDVWRADKLERQVAILDAEPAAAMVQGTPLYWHGWTGQPADLARDVVARAPARPNSLVGPPALLLSALQGTAPSSWPSDVLLRREAVDAVGGFEERFRDVYEDQAFFAKLLLTHAVYVTDECWMKYRQHDRSCSATSRREGRRRAARRVYLLWLAEYLARQPGVDPSILRALEEQRRPYRLAARVRRRLAGVARSARQALGAPWQAATGPRR